MADKGKASTTTITPALINRFLVVAEEMLGRDGVEPRQIAGAMIVALDTFSKIGMKSTMTEAERHEELIFMLNNIREIGRVN